MYMFRTHSLDPLCKNRDELDDEYLDSAGGCHTELLFIKFLHNGFEVIEDDFAVLIADKLQLKQSVGSITDESRESNISIIEKKMPKGMGFSDFICNFAMFCCDVYCFVFSIQI